MARRRTPRPATTEDYPADDVVENEQAEEVVQDKVVETVTEEASQQEINKHKNPLKLPAKDTSPDKDVKDPFWLEPGDIISLNMKQRAMVMFPLPAGEIFRMNHRKWFAEIPDNTPKDWLKALMLLYEQGDIIKGKKHLPKYPKNPKVLEKCKQYLDYPIDRLILKLKPLVIHKGLIEGYRSAEIIMALMRYEQEHYHRKQYIDILNDALEHIGGDAPITQNPVENITSEAAEELENDLR